MKFEMTSYEISKERVVFENNLPTDNYEVTITIGLQPTDRFMPPFF